MKFLRFKHGNTEYRGILDGDTVVRINGTIFHDYSITDDTYSLSDVKILQPILPSKIIGYKKNYNGSKELIKPAIFFKPPTSVIASGDDIIIPQNLEKVVIEAEIAVVISKRCKNIKAAKAKEYIFGYTAANDITGIAANISETVTEGKAYDTFTPLGEFIDSTYDPSDRSIASYINDNVVQNGRSSSIIYNAYELIAHASQIMTLLPGDVILTGTPSDSYQIKKGDSVKIVIDGLGTIDNRAV